MKKLELYAFRRGLEIAKFQHPRLTYAVNKNKRLVADVIEDMEKTIEPDERMKEFQKKREELAAKHCLKDDAGNPKTKMVPGVNGGASQMAYDIPDHDNPNSEYRKKLTKLEKDYNEDIEKHRERERKYNDEFLKDESDFSPFMVNLDLLEAHEKCPQNVMDLIHWMIKVE